MFMPELGFDDDDAAIHTGEGASQAVVIAADKSRGPKVLPVGKPIRRRSRASKKSPATLLNANASNFRALVQQFTGCHSSSSPLLSPFGMTTTTNYKGPINLNFAQHKSRNLGRWGVAAADDDDEQVDQQSFFSFTTNINMADVITYTTTTTTTDHDRDNELFHHVSAVNNNYELPATPDHDHHPLTLDDFDLENLSLQQLMSGPADYSTLPSSGDII